MTSWTPVNCVVVGASGGLGSAFVGHLAGMPSVETIWCLSRTEKAPTISEKVRHERLDYNDPPSVAAAAEIIKTAVKTVDLVIVATGLLHDVTGLGPEKSLRDLNPDRLASVYHINAIGPLLVAQSFLPLMRREGKTVFAALSARVGSISDNRIGGWYGYRAAKAGLNQLLRTAAIEHRRRWKEGIIIGLHPGTVDTDLSKPFQRNVPEENLFQPRYSASRMLDVIARANVSDTGNVLAYDGSQVPA